MFVRFEQWNNRRHDFDTVTEPLEQWLADHMNHGGIEDKIKRVCSITAMIAAEFLKAHPEKFQDVLYHLEDDDGVRHSLVESET